GIIAQYEREAQRLDPTRRVRGVEGVADLLRILGPLDAAEVAARLVAAEDTVTSGAHASDAPAAEMPETAPATLAEAAAHLDALIEARRAIRVTIAGAARVAAIEDAGRLRDALGSALPVGIPT